MAVVVPLIWWPQAIKKTEVLASAEMGMEANSYEFGGTGHAW